MENQKAIEWLKAISATQNEGLNKVGLAERKEALYMAISSLRNDIPRKPHPYIANDGIERNGCPKCFEEKSRNEILYTGQKYCSVCGQAIDWSDTI